MNCTLLKEIIHTSTNGRSIQGFACHTVNTNRFVKTTKNLKKEYNLFVETIDLLNLPIIKGHWTIGTSHNLFKICFTLIVGCVLGKPAIE